MTNGNSINKPKSNEPAPPPKDDKNQASDILKPTETDRKIEEPKKRHGLRNCLIILIIIILLIILGVALTGLYEIPGLSAITGMNKPKDLGVKTSPEALASLKEKIPMTISGEQTDYSTGAENIFTGEIPVDTQMTAEEITSWLHRHQRPDPILSDLQVKQFEGGLEISAMANQYIKAPVYAEVNVNLVNKTTVDLDIQKGKVGIFSVPEKYLDQVEEALEDKINSLISRVPGFSIETYELHDGYTEFKGTFPENVKPSPLGWSDLLNY